MAKTVQKSGPGRIQCGIHGIANKVNGAAFVSYNVWIMPTTISGATTTGNRYGNGLSGSNTTMMAFGLDDSGTPVIMIGGRSQTSDGFQSARSTTTVTTGVWYNVGAIFDYAGDTIKVYLNGVLEVTQAVTFGASVYTRSGTAPTLNDAQAGGPQVGTSAQCFEGHVAEVAFWTSDIGDAGMAQLAAKMSAANVSPQSLVSYTPYIVTFIDVVNGNTTVTDGSVTTVAHPPTYRD